MAPPMPQPGRVAFVVGNASDPTPGDRRMAAHLRERGLEVRLVDHSQPTMAIGGGGLILLSASCASTNIAGSFRDVPQPVISLEAFVLDDMGLTGPERSVDHDEDQATTIAIASTHELTAGLSGVLTISPSMANMAWGRPVPGAIRVATLAANADKAAVFAYDRGTPMIGLSAPARRVAFFASDVLVETMNDDGWRLFDAAIVWAFR